MRCVVVPGVVVTALLAVATPAASAATVGNAATVDRVEAGDLQIMYGIDGRAELDEETLDHLFGYEGARPVRVGNDAWHHRQHDVWGVLLDSVRLHTQSGDHLDDRLWSLLAR